MTEIPQIIVAINYVNYSNYLRKRWQEAALRTLANNAPSNVKIVCLNYSDEEVDVPDSFLVLKQLKRDSQKEIGNSRRLPYIKEIFDACSLMSCDVFGYLNSDILVHRKFFDVFKTKKIDAYLFNRVDINEVPIQNFNGYDFKVIWNGHPGFDGVFFRTKWWLKNRNKFHDDLILGEAEWDYYYNKKIQESTDRIYKKRWLYHVFHETTWTLDSRGAKNNRKINGSIS